MERDPSWYLWRPTTYVSHSIRKNQILTLSGHEWASFLPGTARIEMNNHEPSPPINSHFLKGEKRTEQGIAKIQKTPLNQTYGSSREEVVHLLFGQEWDMAREQCMMTSVLAILDLQLTVTYEFSV